ncbi:MAG: HIT family protein [Bacteroidota bacterium]
MASIFTRIVEGEIPCYKIAESDRFFAFLDINPVQKGHTLVIPKQETDYLFDVENETLGGLIVFAKSIARAIDTSLQPIRTGIIVEGLEVPHAHIHLIPIYDANQSFSLGRSLSLPSEEMQSIAQTISAEVHL